MGRIDSALITVSERLYYAAHRRAHVVDWLAAELGARGVDSCVLDFGGGCGAVARELGARLGVRVVVADIDESALVRVPRSHALHPVRIPPEPPLPFGDAVFDGIVLVDVLHHVQERGRLLPELARVLRPAGVLVIIEFEPDRLATRLFRRLARLGGRRCVFESREALASRLASLDLEVRTTALDGLRYGVVGAA